MAISLALPSPFVFMKTISEIESLTQSTELTYRVTNSHSTCIMTTLALRVYAVWFLVFLVVVSLVVLSYYAENGKAYSMAQLPSARTDGTSSSSGSSTPGGLLVLVSLLALLGMVTLR